MKIHIDGKGHITMNKFIQTFLWLTDPDNEFDYLITLPDEDKFKKHYSCGECLSFNFPKDYELTGFQKNRAEYIILSLKCIYSIEEIFEQIKRDGFNVKNTRDLADDIVVLHTWVSNLFLEDIFEKRSKLDEKERRRGIDIKEHCTVDYDLYSFGKDLSNWHLLLNSTKDDENIHKRLNAAGFAAAYENILIPYMECLLRHVKFMVALMIMRESPIYSHELAQMSAELVDLFRHLLLNKRILGVFVDSKDMERGELVGSKATTKLEVFFSLDNGDMYCLRLDYGHEGHEYIHLNINEPGKEHGDSAFPISVDSEEYYEIKKLSGDWFNTLFLERDDSVWFKARFEKKVNDSNLSPKDKDALKKIFENRTHKKLNVELWSKKNAEEFTSELANICIGLGICNSPYMKLGKTEADYFSYMRCADQMLHITADIMDIAFYENEFITSSMAENLKAFNTFVNKYIPSNSTTHEEKKELLENAESMTVPEYLEYISSLMNSFMEDITNTSPIST